jgi:hypothetical protein
MALAAPGLAAQITCGDVITTSVVFENDVTSCEGEAAVTISGTGLNVDLNGHRARSLPARMPLAG